MKMETKRRKKNQLKLYVIYLTVITGGEGGERAEGRLGRGEIGGEGREKYLCIKD